MTQIRKCQVLHLIVKTDPSNVLDAYGKKIKDPKMCNQVAQMKKNGRLLDQALLATTILGALSWALSNDTDKCRLFTLLTGVGIGVSAYAIKGLYNNLAYLQDVFTRYPALVKQIQKMG